MKYYFRLQFAMLNRTLKDFGLVPFFGYLLAAVAFVGLSILLFSKIGLAEYLYDLMAMSLVLKLSQTRRNDFLKSCFPNKAYFRIRILENLIISLPFLMFLTYQNCIISAASLSGASVILAFLNFENRLSFTIPTPFYKWPFEFIVGFRNTFFVIFVAYFLVVMAISAGNFNLGIFAMILVFLICFSFYSKPEDQFYVWVFSSGAGRFLFYKIKIALLSSSLLVFPVVASLCFFFPENMVMVFAFLGIGYLYLATVVMAKYSAFPEPMNLPQGFLLVAGLWFPPLLAGVIPYFYGRSINRLREILG